MKQPKYKKYRARRAENERKRKKLLPKPFWWLRQREPIARFTLYIAILTCGLIFVGILQWGVIMGQLNEMKQDQRAWIAPFQFKFVNLNDTKEPLKVRVFYQNIGHEPAKSLKNWLNFGYIRAPSLPPDQWTDLPIWKNGKSFQRSEMCKGIAQDLKTSIAYPSPTFAFSVDAVKGKDANYPDSLIPVLFNEVKDQRTMLFVIGCFSYETMSSVKYSTFCAFLNPAAGGKDITEWIFSACPVGNDDY